MNEKTLSAIGLREADMRERLYRQCDEDMIFADLTGLFVEIIVEISKTSREKSVIIYDYAKLLEQEIQLFSSEDAYIMGLEAKGAPEKDVLFDYLRKVVIKDNEQRLSIRTQHCFDEITGLLGDKYDLITEFTEIYRTAHGAVKDNILEFIRMGQTSDEDMEVSV